MEDASSGSVSGPALVTAKVAAERLGIKVYDVHQLVRKGELAHLKRTKPGEMFRIYAADLDRWLRENLTREAS